MIKKWLGWVLFTVAFLVVIALAIGQHYVLSSTKLDEAIRKELPPGSTKTQISQFIQSKHPVAYEENGTEVRARLSGLAENMIYRKDVVLTFEVGTDGRLSSWSKKEYLTFF